MAPVAATIANPAIPRYGLGKPKTAACGEVITGPQEMVVLMLQDGV